MSIKNVIPNEKTLTVKLFANKTECKALETCGVSENSLTDTVENEEATCCDPGGGCC